MTGPTRLRPFPCDDCGRVRDPADGPEWYDPSRGFGLACELCGRPLDDLALLVLWHKRLLPGLATVGPAVAKTRRD